ncbi:MAG: hypothetical protein Q9169_008020 [Polycauliona sp. 2 TL-2023]
MPSLSLFPLRFPALPCPSPAHTTHSSQQGHYKLLWRLSNLLLTKPPPRHHFLLRNLVDRHRIIAGPLYDRGYIRSLIIVGTAMTVFGLMMTSLATRYWQIFLAQALCTGLGVGCLYVPSIAIVATYFSSKRALAVGLTSAGGSLSMLFFPWLDRLDRLLLAALAWEVG